MCICIKNDQRRSHASSNLWSGCRDWVCSLVFYFFAPSSSINTGNSAVTLGQEGQTISIDFGVNLTERDIIIRKGETVGVPATIEAKGNLEIILNLLVVPAPIEPDSPGVADASELALSLDNETVILSKDNIEKGKARMRDNITIGREWVITDAGFLTVTVSPTSKGGTYEYIVEANWAGESGGFGGTGSGQLITVTITD